MSCRWIVSTRPRSSPPRHTDPTPASAPRSSGPDDSGEQLALKQSTERPRLRGASHKWAFFVSLPAGAALVWAAPAGEASAAALLYAVAVAALLGVSALYHRVEWRPPARRWMRRLDHAMIFVLIAATNTPFALLALHGTLATVILAIAWAGALGGVVLQIAWTDHPKWASAGIGVALGWVGIATLTQLPRTIGWPSVAILIAAGLIYTAGAVIYARERPNPRPGIFGYHEVFHLLVLVACGMQYGVIAFVVLPLKAA
jgi:hemolysin III